MSLPPLVSPIPPRALFCRSQSSFLNPYLRLSLSVPCSCLGKTVGAVTEWRASARPNFKPLTQPASPQYVSNSGGQTTGGCIGLRSRARSRRNIPLNGTQKVTTLRHRFDIIITEKKNPHEIPHRILSVVVPRAQEGQSPGPPPRGYVSANQYSISMQMHTHRKM